MNMYGDWTPIDVNCSVRPVSGLSHEAYAAMLWDREDRTLAMREDMRNRGLRHCAIKTVTLKQDN